MHSQCCQHAPTQIYLIVSCPQRASFSTFFFLHRSCLITNRDLLLHNKVVITNKDHHRKVIISSSNQFTFNRLHKNVTAEDVVRLAADAVQRFSVVAASRAVWAVAFRVFIGIDDLRVLNRRLQTRGNRFYSSDSRHNDQMEVAIRGEEL